MDSPLFAPLEVLRDTAQRLTRGQISLTPGRLDELYAHLAGAFTDVLDGAGRQLEEALVHGERSMEALDDPEAAEDFRQVVSETRAQIQEGLDLARETFFAARNFQELQSSLGFLEMAESRIEMALRNLENTLLAAEDPEILALEPREVSHLVPEALHRLAEALEQLARHTRDGRKEAVTAALAEIDHARACLAQVLEQE